MLSRLALEPETPLCVCVDPCKAQGSNNIYGNSKSGNTNLVIEYVLYVDQPHIYKEVCGGMSWRRGQLARRRYLDAQIV
jgi:hypothetical protein